MNKPISEKICQFRKLKSLTQAELGEKLGVSPQAVSKWEKGESLPDIMLLPTLCQVLGVSTDTLLEVPSSVKKENCLSAVASYAKTVGGVNAVADTMEACARSLDDRMVSGSARMCEDGICLYSMDGLGFVVKGGAMLERLKNINGDEVEKLCALISDKEALKLIADLEFFKGASAEALSADTGISIEKTESVLLKLLSRGYCECDPNGDYMLGNRAYALIALLCGLYLCTAEGCKDINSVNKSYPF